MTLVSFYSNRLYKFLPFSSYIAHYSKLITMKLPETKMKSFLKPGVMVLSQVLSQAGFEMRIVGGAVRDILMDIEPSDLDIATTAPFHLMKEVFLKQQIRILRFSEKHQTILVRIEDENLDLTTLFSESYDPATKNDDHGETLSPWEVDASHRDLTINALYLGIDGTVYDYFNGIDDLKNGRVAFVMDPDQRIKEEPSRILRYYRFFARLTRDLLDHDQVSLASIRRNCDKASTIFPEVIWKELKMIISGRFGCEMILQMMDIGVGYYIGFPKDFDCKELKQVYKRLQNSEVELQIDPSALISSGFTSEEDITDFSKKLKLSHKESVIMNVIFARRNDFSTQPSRVLKDVLVDLVYKEKRSPKLAVDVVSELTKIVGRSDLLSEVCASRIPEFPLKGGTLVGKVERKQISAEMTRLLKLWQESNYSLGFEELLTKVKP